MTGLLDFVLILKGEILSWSLMRVKGLKVSIQGVYEGGTGEYIN